MNLYIGDLHFGHKNVITFDNRPFQDIEEMDRILIEAWNRRVSNKDTIYHKDLVNFDDKHTILYKLIIPV